MRAKRSRIARARACVPSGSGPPPPTSSSNGASPFSTASRASARSSSISGVQSFTATPILNRAPDRAPAPAFGTTVPGGILRSRPRPSFAQASAPGKTRDERVDPMSGNPFRYDGKRVVVTGGASGLGAALVALLSDLGAARITVLDQKPPIGSVTYLETDLGDAASIDAAVSSIEGSVDALFNNAGVSAKKPTPVVLAVNFLGLRRLSERLLPRIPRGGAIVNTASLAGNQWPVRVAAIDELLGIPEW